MDIMDHWNVQAHCQDYNAQTGICAHKRQRYFCRECGGDGICEHGELRGTCQQCFGIGHDGKRRRITQNGFLNMDYTNFVQSAQAKAAPEPKEPVFNRWMANGNGTLSKLEPRQSVPYWFCRKCWTKDGSWKLRSIKLLSENTATFVNGHTNSFCSSWGAGGERLEDPKDRHRQYGAAFKRAQQTSELHDIAFKTFKERYPSNIIDDGALNEYINGYT